MSEPIDLYDYRHQVRAWLADNLDRSDGRVMLRGHGHVTPESMAVERALQARIHEAGYAGITIPEEYGGQGLGTAHQQVWNEESSGYRLPNFGVAGGTTFGVCLSTMLVHASADFLARHVPPILRGDHLWVQFFSEPGAGSDLAGVKTRADRDGDTWLLNGSKIWSSGAYYADFGMCLARTNWDVPKHRGLTWFAVRCDAEGVVVDPIREINGDIEFCQEFFTDVVLTDDDVIGEVDHGWDVARTMLVFERGGGGEQRVGSGAGGRRSRTSGLPPALVAAARATGTDQDPVTRQKIAQAHILDHVQRQVSGRIARLTAEGLPPAGVASYGKYASGIWDVERARIEMELTRGTALVWEPDDLDAQATTTRYLNSKIMAIAGGTNQMQLNAIGEQVLGLPREPTFDSVKPYREVVRDAQNWSGKVG